jgi:hypothetical protein
MFPAPGPRPPSRRIYWIRTTPTCTGRRRARRLSRPRSSSRTGWCAAPSSSTGTAAPRLLNWWIEQPAFAPHFRAFAAYDYNRGVEWGCPAAMHYTHGAFLGGAAVFDVECGQLAGIRKPSWQMDTSMSRSRGATSGIRLQRGDRTPRRPRRHREQDRCAPAQHRAEVELDNPSRGRRPGRGDRPARRQRRGRLGVRP